MIRTVSHFVALGLTVAGLAGSVWADDIEDALCGDVEPCFVASARPAGTDDSGNTMEVVEVVFGEPDVDWRSPVFDGECVRDRYWLVHRSDEGVTSRQLLVDLCNDGYGASGIGSDEVTVEPNRLVHEQYGGSAWRWTDSTELQLSPLRIVSQSAGGFWTLGPNGVQQQWSWPAFRGAVSWGSPRCDEEPVAEWDIDGGGDRDYLPIPAVTLDPAAPPIDWAATGLGGCSLALDSGSERAFVVHGGPGAPDDATMRVVVLAPRTLIVEVHDDHWVSGSASWLYDDHVELWLGEASGPDLYMEHCLEGTHRARQWGIRVADGAVFPAAGDPEPLPPVRRFEAAHGDGPIVLVIDLPEDPRAITVVYSDSDDGESQERLIANSELIFGDPYSLGGVFHVVPSMAVCTVRDGSLEVTDTQSFNPDVAVVGSP